MPQASELQRNRWRGPNPGYAEGYLEGRGYVLDGDWNWRHPEPGWKPSARDYDAMRFMADEWDYGWWEPAALGDDHE